MRLLVVLLGAGILTTTAAAAREPTLLTARPSGGHVVVTFEAGDLVPADVEVSSRPARSSTGGFVASYVKVRERIPAAAGTAPGRYRTRGVLAPGTYYVAVSGVLRDPPPSCIPLRSHCAERWSNTRQVTVTP